MNRRNAIKNATLLLGGTLSASTVMAVMSGCKAERAANRTSSFFTTDEANIVECIVDRIIPRTDTPGAVDAGVHLLIDKMMAEYYPKEESTAFREALLQVDHDAKKTFGNAFVRLNTGQQDQLLEKYDKAAFADNGEEKTFFRKIKELTILGFCTSEPGATEFLKYDPLPGDYNGCIPYEEVGAAWAT
ncbi:MAG TPA: gluconate 2-dehydrogenase subunit 3 family protein [Bacteroidetes bacterium]|nr:gluconate 2-dehydrogenase subunit 3 family protein [Bacteroidota bacterium]